MRLIDFYFFMLDFVGTHVFVLSKFFLWLCFARRGGILDGLVLSLVVGYVGLSTTYFSEIIVV